MASANHNCRLNGVDGSVEVVRSDLLHSDIAADIVLANITADVLERLAPSIPKNLKRGGALILSGIIDGKLKCVIDAYEAQGLTLESRQKRGEWNALAFRNL